jgi:Cft2 family RNA processing exonuclease
MRIEFTGAGIHLPDIGLWLDPQAGVEAAWLSHGHSDHARGVHGTAVGTPATLDIYKERWPLEPESRRFLPLQPGESLDWNGARLTCHRAAHVLGAAQLLIEFRNERVVYTGDIKSNRPMLGWETDPVDCDRLIIESTFGLPVYRFLDRESAAARIVRFAKESLEDGKTPVFFGYPLGRGQEIAWALCREGVPVSVHGAIARYIPFYESAGYEFPGWESYASRRKGPGAVVVTPDMRAQMEASGNTRMALVSGWAMFDAARARTGADVLIPYSDHGGYGELLTLVEQSGATEVDVVHGYAEEFAGVLRARGLNARSHGETRSEEPEV